MTSREMIKRTMQRNAKEKTARTIKTDASSETEEEPEERVEAGRVGVVEARFDKPVAGLGVVAPRNS